MGRKPLSVKEILVELLSKRKSLQAVFTLISTPFLLGPSVVVWWSLRLGNMYEVAVAAHGEEVFLPVVSTFSLGSMNSGLLS